MTQTPDRSLSAPPAAYWLIQRGPYAALCRILDVDVAREAAHFLWTVGWREILGCHARWRPAPVEIREVEIPENGLLAWELYWIELRQAAGKPDEKLREVYRRHLMEWAQKRGYRGRVVRIPPGRRVS